MKAPMRRFSETVQIRSSIINRIRLHRYFQLFLLISVVLLASCLHIWQRVVVLDLVADVSRLRIENASLIDATRKIHTDNTALSSSARIERYATDSLGLATISPERLYTLIGKRHETPEPIDEMAAVLSAVKRMAAYMPTVAKSSASAGELPSATLDSLTGTDGSR